uniref:Uncharacterized protein n=1 Tax=Avena sativa TaxID=4498 RepID=A0ACD6ANV0_AVESA
MARTPSTARWRGTRHRVLVLSLLAQDLTAADHKKITTGPVPGVTTRARSRRAATAFAALPEDVLVWEVFVRLPAKDILRCRAVCRSWRILTSAVDFVLAHHRRQPSSPLVTLYGTASADPVYKGGSPILWFDDYNGFKIHASCDGLLLLSLSDCCFSICNPTTRQCAPLPGLPAAGCITVAVLYQHGPSGEYRVLYWKGTDKDHLKAAYYILVVPQGRSPRCIGVPSHPPWHRESYAGLAWSRCY